jgi:hypothetical protein
MSLVLNYRQSNIAPPNSNPHSRSVFSSFSNLYGETRLWMTLGGSNNAKGASSMEKKDNTSLDRMYAKVLCTVGAADSSPRGRHTFGIQLALKAKNHLRYIEL